MAYDKQSWSDGPEGGTPIDADSLNHMEDGIKDLDNQKTPKLSTRTPTVHETLLRTNFTGTLVVSLSNIMEHWVGSKMVGWVNEWGALRGRNPYPTYSDALVRAVKDSGDYVGTGGGGGNALEIVDRTLPAGTKQQMWGVRWATGNTVRNGIEVSEVFATTDPDDSRIADLPNGTIIMVFGDEV